MASFFKRHGIRLAFLLVLAGGLCLWAYEILISPKPEPFYSVTAFQCVQLFSTFMIGCWITHVVSASYSKASKRLSTYCDSIDKMREMIEVNKAMLLAYATNCPLQKDPQSSKEVLVFFSNLGTELSFLDESLKNDGVTFSRDILDSCLALTSLLRRTKDIITEQALCTATRTKKPNDQMVLSAQNFVGQFSTGLRSLKVKLLQ